MARATLKVKLSDSPALAILLDDRKLQASDRELELAGERQKQRIIERTRRGVDYLGRAFAPYSTKGPFYYYPAQTTASHASRKAAAGRLAKRFGAPLTRSHLGIRFESYAAFKQAMGRGTAVDLTGPRAPHMLQSMVVTVNQGVIQIGFYDPKKAAIALGHNTGATTGRNYRTKLPKRAFFNVSPEDRRLIQADVAAAVRERLKSGNPEAQGVTPRWAATQAFTLAAGKLIKGALRL